MEVIAPGRAASQQHGLRLMSVVTAAVSRGLGAASVAVSAIGMSAPEQSGDAGYKAVTDGVGQSAFSNGLRLRSSANSGPSIVSEANTTLVKGPRDQPGTIRHRFKKAALQHW
ncbi:hypothetical protein JOM56_012573 [Amanita muscaria]